MQSNADDLPSQALATLASQGGAFNWLAEEPEIYSDTDGEPLSFPQTSTRLYE